MCPSIFKIINSSNQRKTFCDGRIFFSSVTEGYFSFLWRKDIFLFCDVRIFFFSVTEGYFSFLWQKDIFLFCDGRIFFFSILHTFVFVSMHIKIGYLERCAIIQNLLFYISKKTHHDKLLSHISFLFRYFSFRGKTLERILTVKIIR